SGVTGGPLMYLGGADDSALARVARETSGYYIARVEPEPSETAGALRGLDISVARPATRFMNSSGLTPLGMMKEARLFRDLPLRVTAYASRESGTARVRVVTMFDSPDASAAVSSAMVALFDDDMAGRQARRWVSRLKWRPRARPVAGCSGHYEKYPGNPVSVILFLL
ncbi:MAG: hypothetical protein NUW22_01035, partial [Acidobacteria bacterium]|nr:hypothetical protein [Acidobacteriota bacterium]